MLTDYSQDPEMGLSDIQAAQLLGISVHTLRAFRKGKAPYSGPRFLKLSSRVIYKRGDVLEWRETQSTASCMDYETQATLV